jgi:hypothetical protein
LDKYEEEEEEDIRKYHFPDGFLFGTSTSSYQALLLLLLLSSFIAYFGSV